MSNTDKRTVRSFFSKEDQTTLTNISEMLKRNGFEASESASIRYAVRRAERAMKNDPMFQGGA